MNIMKIGAAGLALAVTAVIVPATAQAADDPVVVEGNLDRPYIIVSYADLNLAEEAGVNRLNRRVRTAATRLCIEPGLQTVRQEMDDQSCRLKAIADAKEQITLAVASFGTTRLAAATPRQIKVALR